MSRLLTILVNDHPGALARVSGLFARRGYNIDSLAVGLTEQAGVSRITVGVDCGEEALALIVKQCHKLVDVLKVTALEPGEAVERELALIRVAARPDQRAQLVALAGVFSARVSDVEAESLLFEIAASPDQLDSLVELLYPYGITEMGRTGRLALARGRVNGACAPPRAATTPL